MVLVLICVASGAFTLAAMLIVDLVMAVMAGQVLMMWRLELAGVLLAVALACGAGAAMLDVLYKIERRLRQFGERLEEAGAGNGGRLESMRAEAARGSARPGRRFGDSALDRDAPPPRLAEAIREAEAQQQRAAERQREEPTSTPTPRLGEAPRGAVPGA